MNFIAKSQCSQIIMRNLGLSIFFESNLMLVIFIFFYLILYQFIRLFLKSTIIFPIFQLVLLLLFLYLVLTIGGLALDAFDVAAGWTDIAEVSNAVVTVPNVVFDLLVKIRSFSFWKSYLQNYFVSESKQARIMRQLLIYIWTLISCLCIRKIEKVILSQVMFKQQINNCLM